MDLKTPKIIVLAGGTSDEREVSLRSGTAVQAALKQAGYTADLFDVTSYEFTPEIFDGYDIAFPVLHGKGGEDGLLQSKLDELGVTYIGTGHTASELCFDKAKYRNVLTAHNMPVAAGELVTGSSVWNSQIITKPFVLKPNDGGSSVDTYILRDVVELSRETINDIFTRHETMLLEELIVGIEITVGVLGNQSLPVVEIIPPENAEFDYENKYNGATRELCPPENLSTEVQQRAQALAAEIHQLTGCRHYSRTDMIVQADGSLVVLETNTLPGMTDQSLLPKAAAAAGIAMPELCGQLVQMALSD